MSGDPDSRAMLPTPPTTAWAEIAERALAGDRVAYARLVRLATGYLGRWRAFDFRGDWDDIVQEVLVSTLQAHQEGRLENAAAFQAYVRQATRFKFVDRIRASRRRVVEFDEARPEPAASVPAEDAPWPPRQSVSAAGAAVGAEVRQAVAQLEDRERIAVLEVYLRGKTYTEAAEANSIPLGSLKRALKTGLARLREVLNEDPPV